MHHASARHQPQLQLDEQGKRTEEHGGTEGIMRAPRGAARAQRHLGVAAREPHRHQPPRRVRECRWPLLLLATAPLRLLASATRVTARRAVRRGVSPERLWRGVAELQLDRLESYHDALEFKVS